MKKHKEAIIKIFQLDD